MKKIIFAVLILAVLLVGLMLLLGRCGYDVRGHKIYDSLDDYDKAFELSGIKNLEDSRAFFPEDIEELSTQSFYCEWELGAIGDADVEMCLSVQYGESGLQDEIERLLEYADSKVVYDPVSFKYPAYVLTLGYDGASWYALVDNQNMVVHYIMLQLIDVDRIDINKDFLPDGYYDFGYVKNQSYSAFESEETEK